MDALGRFFSRPVISSDSYTQANNFVVTATVLKQYQANALALHSPEMDRIREAVKEADVTAVIGFAERDGGSLYISQATILPDGKIANHRRKIKASYPLTTPQRRMNSILTDFPPPAHSL